jgi:hypothetical protein
VCVNDQQRLGANLCDIVQGNMLSC